MPDDKSKTVSRDQSLELEHLKKSIEMLDDRLDNLDSVVTAVVERMMKRLVGMELTCPHCGKKIEVSLISTERIKK